MKGLGSGDNGEFTFLDMITIISFFIGIQNLDLNITQDDFQKATADLDKHVNEGINQVLSEIHSHLKRQDEKIETILKLLEGSENDS